MGVTGETEELPSTDEKRVAEIPHRYGQAGAPISSSSDLSSTIDSLARRRPGYGFTVTIATSSSESSS